MSREWGKREKPVELPFLGQCVPKILVAHSHPTNSFLIFSFWSALHPIRALDTRFARRNGGKGNSERDVFLHESWLRWGTLDTNLQAEIKLWLMQLETKEDATSLMFNWFATWSRRDRSSELPVIGEMVPKTRFARQEKRVGSPSGHDWAERADHRKQCRCIFTVRSASPSSLLLVGNEDSWNEQQIHEGVMQRVVGPGLAITTYKSKIIIEDESHQKATLTFVYLCFVTQNLTISQRYLKEY